MAPIPDPYSSKGRLAGELRTGRVRRGLTRQEVSLKVGTSIATVQRAESGRGLPTLETARAIAAVCQLNEERIESFWRKASQRGRQQHLTRARPLQQITDAAELGVAPRRVWEMNGCPSVDEMERRVRVRAGEFVRLSRSTGWRIRERDQSVTSEKQLFAYLVACEVSDKRFRLWSETWHRVRQVESRGERTGDARRQGLKAVEAEQRLYEVGFIPQERYPGSMVPWTVRCRRRACRQVSQPFADRERGRVARGNHTPLASASPAGLTSDVGLGDGPLARGVVLVGFGPCGFEGGDGAVDVAVGPPDVAQDAVLAALPAQGGDGGEGGGEVAADAGEVGQAAAGARSEPVAGVGDLAHAVHGASANLKSQVKLLA